MKNWLLVGTTRGPCTWNAVLPSTFTQLPGSALVANAAVGCAIGAIGNSTTNGFVTGLGGRPSPNAERRNVGPSKPYALPAKLALRISRLVNIASPRNCSERDCAHRAHSVCMSRKFLSGTQQRSGSRTYLRQSADVLLGKSAMRLR